MSSKTTPLSEKLNIPNDTLILGLVALQAFTVTGVLVTGRLARKRRLELVNVNEKLRLVRPCPPVPCHAPGAHHVFMQQLPRLW